MDALHAISRITATAIVFECLVACYPRPHDYISTQEFSGVLIKGGVAVSGATVLVGHFGRDTDAHCADAKAVAVTDKDGSFYVASVVEKRLFASMINPPQLIQQIGTICFRTPSEQKLGVTVVAPTDHKLRYLLSCDLDAAPVEFIGTGQFSMAQWGICKNAEIKS
jgi:hypothetical protein